MRRALTVLVLVLIVTGLVAAPASATGKRPVRAAVLEADLNGANEVPGPGDPDGSGHAFVLVLPRFNLVCWSITVENIDDVILAHIHEGTADVSGPVVVDFEGQLQGCRDDVDRALARDIASKPAGYYVNVHTSPFPAGAVRGNLSRLRG
jgi:hypothetical protein